MHVGLARQQPDGELTGSQASSLVVQSPCRPSRHRLPAGLARQQLDAAAGSGVAGPGASQFPALGVSNSSNAVLSPIASKVLSHRVPMGGGYMQNYSHSKQVPAKAGSLVGSNSKFAKGAMPSNPNPRSSALRGKYPRASAISTVAPVLSTKSKPYISPYSQQVMNTLRES